MSPASRKGFPPFLNSEGPERNGPTSPVPRGKGRHMFIKREINTLFREKGTAGRNLNGKGKKIFRHEGKRFAPKSPQSLLRRHRGEEAKGIPREKRTARPPGGKEYFPSQGGKGWGPPLREKKKTR